MLHLSATSFCIFILGTHAIKILMVSNKGVNVYNTSSGERAELMTENEMQMKEVDYHLARKEVYAMTTRQILRCPLTMTSSREYHPVVYSEDEYSFMSLAVDWVHDALFWTGGPAFTIYRARLDGSDRRVIYKGYYLDHTHKKMLVDPNAGLLIWATSSQIYRSTLEGADVRQVHFPEVLGEHRSRVKNLAIDTVRQRVYFLAGFVDDDVWLMMSGNYDGTGFRRHDAVSRFTFAIAALGDYVYWIVKEMREATYEPGGRPQPHNLVLYRGEVQTGTRTTERIMDLNAGGSCTCSGVCTYHWEEAGLKCEAIWNVYETIL